MGASLLALAKSIYIISKTTERANYFNIRESNLSFAGNHGNMAITENLNRTTVRL